MTKAQVFAAFSKGGDITEFENLVNNPNTPQDQKNQLLAWYEEAIGERLAVGSPEFLEPEEAENIVRKITEKPLTLAEQAVANSRMRAKRGNMLRKLKRTYSSFELFTIKDAADRTNTPMSAMASYLASEARLPGSDIHRDPESGKFFLQITF